MATTKPTRIKRRGMLSSVNGSIAETASAIEAGAKTLRITLDTLAITTMYDAVEELTEDYGIPRDEALALLGGK